MSYQPGGNPILLNNMTKRAFYFGITALFTIPLIRTLYPGFPPIFNGWGFWIPAAFTVTIAGFFFLGRPPVKSKPNKGTPQTTPFLHNAFSRNKVNIWLPPMLVCGFAVVYLIIDLDHHNFVNDEYQVVATAWGYLKTGHFNRWDFCTDTLTRNDYLRAFPHTWLVAQSFNIFGMSEWSARIVSVLFGAIFAIVGYFVFLYFTQNRFVSAIGVVSCIVHSPMSLIFRRCRMYSLLVPLALLFFLFLHKTVLSLRNTPFSLKQTLPTWVITALLLLINVTIHINALVILLYLPFFFLFMSVYEKKRIYIVLTLLSFVAFLCLSIWGVYTDLLSVFTGHISPFKQLNYNYFKDLFRSPFPISVGISCYLLAVGLIIMKRTERETKIKLASLIIVNLVGGLFFVFVADRYYGFNYMSFLTPTTTLLVLWTFSLILRRVDTRWAKAVLIATAGLSIVSGIRHPSQRENRFPDFKNAYADIMKSFVPEKNELLITQYLRCLYMRDFASRVRRFDLGKKRSVSFNQFVDAVSAAPSGFAVWDSHKEYHIDKKIHRFIKRCFKARHKSLKQWRGLEVYQFNQRYPCLINVRKMPPHIRKVYSKSPSHVDMGQPFTLAFWHRTQVITPEPPITLGTKMNQGILVESPKNKKGALRFKYGKSGPCSVLDTGVVNDGKWHLLSLYQTGSTPGAEYGVYVDGKKLGACTLAEPQKARVKFLINNFQGETTNIRLYNQAITDEQQQTLYALGTKSAPKALRASNGTAVTPIGYWTARK